MQVFCNGVAKVKIQSTGEVVEVTPDQLTWASEGTGEERGMGAETEHSATVEIKNAVGDDVGHVTWSVWEYPEGVENHKGYVAVGGIEVEADFNYGLR